MTEGTLRFVVDDVTPEPKIKGALPLPFPTASDISAKIVELGTDVVAASITSTLNTIYAIISGLPEAPRGHEVSEIRFKLLVDARGDISVLSAVKGGVTGQSGIEFTISPKR
jgi:hypothetical protein